MTIITKQFNQGDSKLKVHGIQTGRLAIKESSLNTSRPGLLSTLKSFFSKEFGEWLPVWTWLIEHPEGLFLIDTGLSRNVLDPGYFKKIDPISRYYFTTQMRFDIPDDQEIQNQLSKIGISPESIDKIILTHLHIDHTDGLKYFLNTPIIVNQKEWKTMDGSFPKLFPPNLKFQQVTLDEKFKNFENAHMLTEAGDLIMVETSGHTRGHTSIILKLNDTQLIFFGGDVAYNEQRLKERLFSSTIQNHKANINSCNIVMALAKDTEVVFLASHVPDNRARLSQPKVL